MQIFNEISSLKAFLAGQKKIGKSVGFVPTMGALHDGHLALVNESISSNDVTVSSIFVNPTQFNNPDDLRLYPRPLGLDVEKLEKVGCTVLFVPADGEMYPAKPAVSISVPSLDQRLEGAFRPGHFNGVALVVSKLLHIVEPDNAYFGQKDWQQFVIIRQLVEDLNFPVRLHAVPTFREPDGLALSSRNARLSRIERQKSPILFATLIGAKAMLENREPIEKVARWANEQFAGIAGVKLEYFEIVDSTTLEPISSIESSKSPIICTAAYVGEIRLIDNMFLDLRP